MQFCYAAVVLLWLLCPVSFSSVLSVFGVAGVSVTEQGMMRYVSQENGQFQIQNAILSENGTNQVSHISMSENPYLTPFETRADEKEAVSPSSWDLKGICSAVWLTGLAVLWGYSAVSMFLMKKKLVGAVWDVNGSGKNIYLCDYIGTAFVMGVLRPRIYLPTTLNENERQYILLHEQTHIRRGDLIFRLLAFGALSIHWFNPLVWCAFFLSERDMEMSCDEAVMRRMGTDLRAAWLFDYGDYTGYLDGCTETGRKEAVSFLLRGSFLIVP